MTTSLLVTSWEINFAAKHHMFRLLFQDLSIPTTDPNGAGEVMDSSTAVVSDEFSNSFKIFCRLAGASHP